MPNNGQTLRTYKIKIDADIQSALDSIESLQNKAKGKGLENFGDAISSSIQEATKSINELKTSTDKSFKQIQASVNKFSTDKLNTELQSTFDKVQKQTAIIKEQAEMLKTLSETLSKNQGNNNFETFLVKFTEPLSRLNETLRDVREQLRLLNEIKIGAVDANTVELINKEYIRQQKETKKTAEYTKELIDLVDKLAKKSKKYNKEGIVLGDKAGISKNITVSTDYYLDLANAIDLILESSKGLSDFDINQLFDTKKLGVSIKDLRSFVNEIRRANASLTTNQNRPPAYNQGEKITTTVQVNYEVSEKDRTENDINQIISDIQKNVIDKVNERLDKNGDTHISIPIEANIKGLTTNIREEVANINKDIKSGGTQYNIPSIDIDVIPDISKDFDKKVSAISDEINKRTGLNLNGGLLNIDDAGDMGKNISTITSILQNWDSNGIVNNNGIGSQSNQNKNYQKAYDTIDQAREQNVLSKMPLFVNGKTIKQSAKDINEWNKKVIASVQYQQEMLGILKEAGKANTLEKLQKTKLYTTSIVGSDGKAYAKYGHRSDGTRYLLEDWQKVLENSYKNDFFKLKPADYKKAIAAQEQNVKEVIDLVSEISRLDLWNEDEQLERLKKSKIYSSKIQGADGNIYAQYGKNADGSLMLLTDWQKQLEEAFNDKTLINKAKAFKTEFESQIVDIFSINYAKDTTKKNIDRINKSSAPNGLQWEKETETYVDSNGKKRKRATGKYRLLDAKGSTSGSDSIEDLYTRKILEIEAPYKTNIATQKNVVSELEELRNLLREISKNPELAKVEDKVARVKQLARQVKGSNDEEIETNKNIISNLEKEYENLSTKAFTTGVDQTEYNRLNAIPAEIEALYRPIDDIVEFAKEQTEILDSNGLSVIDNQIKEANQNIKDIFQQARWAVKAFLNGVGQLNSETYEAIKNSNVSAFEYITDSKHYKQDKKDLSTKEKRFEQLGRLRTNDGKFTGTKPEEQEYYQLQREIKYIKQRVALHEQAALNQEKINEADKELLDYQLTNVSESSEKTQKGRLQYSQELTNPYYQFMGKVADRGNKELSNIIAVMSDEEVVSFQNSLNTLVSEIEKKENLTEEQIEKLIDQLIDEELKALENDLVKAKAELKQKITDNKSIKSIDNSRQKVESLELGISQLRNAKIGKFDEKVDANEIFKLQDQAKQELQNFIEKFKVNGRHLIGNGSSQVNLEELANGYKDLKISSLSFEKLMDYVDRNGLDKNANINTFDNSSIKYIQKIIGTNFTTIAEAEEMAQQAENRWISNLQLFDEFGENVSQTVIELINKIYNIEQIANAISGGKGNKAGYFVGGAGRGAGTVPGVYENGKNYSIYTKEQYNERRQALRDSLNYGQAEEENVVKINKLLLDEIERRNEKKKQQDEIDNAYKSEIKSNQELLELSKQRLAVVDELIDKTNKEDIDNYINKTTKTLNNKQNKDVYGLLNKLGEINTSSNSSKVISKINKNFNGNISTESIDMFNLIDESNKKIDDISENISRKKKYIDVLNKKLQQEHLVTKDSLDSLPLDARFSYNEETLNAIDDETLKKLNSQKRQELEKDLEEAKQALLNLTTSYSEEVERNTQLIYEASNDYKSVSKQTLLNKLKKYTDNKNKLANNALSKTDRDNLESEVNKNRLDFLNYTKEYYTKSGDINVDQNVLAAVKEIFEYKNKTLINSIESAKQDRESLVHNEKIRDELILQTEELQKQVDAEALRAEEQINFQKGLGRSKANKGISSEIDSKLIELQNLINNEPLDKSSQEFSAWRNIFKETQKELTILQNKAKELGLTVSDITGRAYGGAKNKDNDYIPGVGSLSDIESKYGRITNLEHKFEEDVNTAQYKQRQETQNQIKIQNELNEKVYKEQLNKANKINDAQIKQTQTFNEYSKEVKALKDGRYFAGMSQDQADIAKKLQEILAKTKQGKKATEGQVKEIERLQKLLRNMGVEIGEKGYAKSGISPEAWLSNPFAYNTNSYTDQAIFGKDRSTGGIATENTLQKILEVLLGKKNHSKSNDSDTKKSFSKKKSKIDYANLKTNINSSDAEKSKKAAQELISKGFKIYKNTDKNEIFFKKKNQVTNDKIVDITNTFGKAVKENTKEVNRNTNAKKNANKKNVDKSNTKATTNKNVKPVDAQPSVEVSKETLEIQKLIGNTIEDRIAITQKILKEEERYLKQCKEGSENYKIHAQNIETAKKTLADLTKQQKENNAEINNKIESEKEEAKQSTATTTTVVDNEKKKQKAKKDTKKVSDSSSTVAKTQDEIKSKTNETTSAIEQQTKVYKEWSSSIKYGIDRQLRAKTLNEHGLYPDREKLLSNKKIWDEIANNDWLQNVPEGIERKKAYEQIRERIISEILKNAGLTAEEYVKQIDFKANPYQAKSVNGNLHTYYKTELPINPNDWIQHSQNGGWNFYHKTGSGKFEGDTTYKIYAAFEQLGDFTKETIAEIMNELTKAGFKGDLKTARKASSAGDTDQIVIHAINEQMQELAYKVLSKYGSSTGKHFSYLGGGFDKKDSTGNNSFSSLIEHGELDVEMYKKIAKAEDEVRKASQKSSEQQVSDLSKVAEAQDKVNNAKKESEQTNKSSINTSDNSKLNEAHYNLVNKVTQLTQISEIQKDALKYLSENVDTWEVLQEYYKKYILEMGKCGQTIEALTTDVFKEANYGSQSIGYSPETLLGKGSTGSALYQIIDLLNNPSKINLTSQPQIVQATESINAETIAVAALIKEYERLSNLLQDGGTFANPQDDKMFKSIDGNLWKSGIQPIFDDNNTLVFYDYLNDKDISLEWANQIITGVKSATPELIKAVSEFAKIPEDKVREILQISSPSKVMEKLGFWTGDGLAVGILDSKDEIRKAIIEAIKAGKVTPDEIKELIGWDGLDDLGKSMFNRRTNAGKSRYKNLQDIVKDKDLFSSLPSSTMNLTQIRGKAKDLIGRDFSKEEIEEIKKLGTKVGSGWKVATEELDKYVEKLKSVETTAAKVAEETTTSTKKTPVAIEKLLGLDIDLLNEKQLRSKVDTIKLKMSENPDYRNQLNQKLVEVETKLEKIESARNQMAEESKQHLKDDVELCKDRNDALERAKELVKEIYGIELEDVVDAKLTSNNNKNTWTITGFENKYTVSESIDKETGMLVKQGVQVQELNNEYTQLKKTLIEVDKAKNRFSNLSTLNASMFGDQARDIRNAQNILKYFNDLDVNNLKNDSHAIEDLTEKIKTLQNVSNKLSPDGVVAQLGTETDLSDLNVRKEKLLEIAKAYSLGKEQEVKFSNNNKVLTYSVKDANNMLQTYKYTLKDTGDVTKNLVSETEYVGAFGRAIKGITGEFSKLARYAMASFSIYRVIGFFRSGIQIVQELDTAMTEMQKVSNDTEAALRSFAKESHKIAQEIGSTAATIQNSAADWMRLGYSINEASELAKNTSILMNVSEFDTIDAATESMVAMIQAFKDANADVGELSVEIIDKLNNIGNNYSISTSELAESLKRSSGTLIEAGNSIDEAIALTTAGNAIIQDAESTGSALKVISMRIRGTSAKELEDIGEDAEGLIETTSKLEAKVKSLTKVAGNEGISLLDEKGNYRSTYEILQDIANVWEQINEEDQKTGQNRQAALLELLAGKTRAQSLASLLQNAEMLRDVYEDVQHSEGSAAKENEEYLGSIAAHIEVVKAKWQEMWDSAINREQVNFVVDAAGKLLDILTNAGLVKTLTLMGSVFAGGKLTQFGVNPIDIFKNIANKNTTTSITTMMGGQTFSFGSDQTSLIDQFMKLARAEQDCTDVLTKMTPAARDYAYAALDVEKKTGQVTKGFDAMNKSSRAAAIGTSILNAAINAGIIWLVSVAVEAVIKQFDKWIVTNEELKQSVDELMNSFNSQYETASRNLDTWNKMSEEYGRLAKGVDNLGNNVKLTSEDFKKYNELSNQIAQMSPDLVEGWTNEGVAIISLKNNVDELTNSYINAKKAAYEALIANKDSNNIIKEYQKTIVDNQGWKSSGLTEKQELSQIISESNSIDEIYSNIYNRFGQDYITLKRIQKLLKDEYDLNIDISEDMSRSNTYLFSPINVSQDQLKDIRMVAKAQVHTYQAEINTQLKDVKTLADAYLNLNLLDDSKYSEISDNAKTIASILVQNIDESIASQFKDKNDVDIYVQRILDELSNKDHGEEIQQALSNLYTLDIDNMSIEEAEQQINEYKKILAKYIEDDEIYWNIIVTLQDNGSWKELKENKKAYRNLIDDITEDMFGSSKQKAWLLGDYDAYEEQYEEIQELLDEYGINTKDEADKFRDTWVKAGYDVYKALDKYVEQQVDESKQALSDFLKVETNGTSRADDVDNYLTKISNLQQKITGLRNGTISTSAEIANIATEFGITADSADELADKLDDLIDDEFSEMNKTLDSFIKEAEEAGDTELVNDLNRIKEACASATLEAKNLQNAFSNQKNLGINIIGLDSGMDQINAIYEDVYNKEGFDFTSIIGNEEFYNQFHDYVLEYDQLIDAISDSPDDIEACQEAFDDLADAYIKSGNALDDLTESNKNHAKTYLESLGVVNADEMIQAEFISQDIDAEISALQEASEARLKYNQAALEELQLRDPQNQYIEKLIENIDSENDALYENIAALFEEEGALNNATEAQKAYFLEKQFSQIDFVSQDIEQLNLIVQALGLGSAAWSQYYATRIKMASLADIVEQGGADAVVAQGALIGLGATAEDDLKAYQEELSSLASGYRIKPPAIAKAEKEEAAGSGKDAADAYMEAYEKELEQLEWLRDNGFITEKEYLDRFRNLYEKYFKDVTGYAKKFYEEQRKYLEGMKSLYQSAGNAAIYFLKKQIDGYNKEKDKALESLNAQKDAIDDQVKAKQKVIDGINDEIDAIQKANEARSKQIQLQRDLYQLEKAQHQRTKLVKICQL